MWDYEYVRNGVVYGISFEPLRSKREVIMTERRARIEFTQTLKHLSDSMYPHVEKILLVMDNLNTYSIGLLYEAFEPEEVKRLADRFDIHYTPLHG